MNPFSGLKKRFNNGETFVSLSKEECAKCQEAVHKNDTCIQVLEQTGVAILTGLATGTVTGLYAMMGGVDPRVSFISAGGVVLFRTLIGIPIAAHSAKQFEKGLAFMQQHGRPFAEVRGMLEPIPTCERPDRLAQTYKKSLEP